MKSILILDDNKDLTFILEMTMEEFGVPLFKAINSYDELVALTDDLFLFEVALLDINLGEGKPDGLDAFKFLKSKLYLGEVIFFSGHGIHDSRVQLALTNSHSRLIQKPASMEILYEIIK